MNDYLARNRQKQRDWYERNRQHAAASIAAARARRAGHCGNPACRVQLRTPGATYCRRCAGLARRKETTP